MIFVYRYIFVDLMRLFKSEHFQATQFPSRIVTQYMGAIFGSIHLSAPSGNFDIYS